MTYNITERNRLQIADLNNSYFRKDESKEIRFASLIGNLVNDPFVENEVKDFLRNPSLAETTSALIDKFCMKGLPPEVANATMSQKGESVKSLLGLISDNISDKQDKATLNKVFSQLIKAKGDMTKEAKVEGDLNRLLIKYGVTSLKNHIDNCLYASRMAWEYNHNITVPLEEIDDHLIFTPDLLACHNVLKEDIQKISKGGLDFHSIAQQADFIKNHCESIPHTLINHDNEAPGSNARSPEPNRFKTAGPQVSAPANYGPRPVNIHVEGATANATINGNSSPSPTLTTSDLALIDFATKLVETRPEDLTETKVQLINKALDLVRDRDSHNRGAGGIIQNLQSVTPAQQVSSHEHVSANQRLAQIVQQPDTSAAEKPADSANSESLIMSAKRLQPLPLANDIAEIDFTGIDSAAAFSAAIVPKMIPGTRRQDLNKSAERNSTAPELKGKTTKPEQSETPAKLVETSQTELVTYSVDNKVDLTSQVADAVDERSIREAPLLHAAKQVSESLSGILDNITVAITQPSDSRTHPRDGTGIHSGGNPNNPLDSGSKDSRSDERDIFADNQPAYGGSGSYVKQTVNRLEKEFIRLRPKGTPFVSGNSIFGNNSVSGAKSSAERKSHQQNTTKNNRSSITGNSPRIHTTNRSFDSFNQRSIPSVQHVRQFSPGSAEINKGVLKKAENNIGQVFLDNQELQHE